MLTPTSTSARGSTRAVGCRPEPSLTGISLELTHAFFQRAHLAHELRQHRLRGPDAAREGGGPARGAAHHLPRLHVAGHAGLSGEDGALADAHVIGDANLPGEDGAIADGAGAGDTNLGHQDDVLADLAVVPHLHEVVDFTPASDDGVADRGA